MDINSPYYGCKREYLENNSFFLQRRENEAAFEQLFDKTIESKIKRILLNTVKNLKCVENLLPNLSKQKSIASLLKYGTTLELEEMDRICQKLPENIETNEIEMKESNSTDIDNNNVNECDWYEIYRTAAKMWIVIKNIDQLNKLCSMQTNHLQQKTSELGRIAKILVDNEHTLQFVWIRKSRIFALEQYWHQNEVTDSIDSDAQ